MRTSIRNASWTQLSPSCGTAAGPTDTTNNTRPLPPLFPALASAARRPPVPLPVRHPPSLARGAAGGGTNCKLAVSFVQPQKFCWDWCVRNVWRAETDRSQQIRFSRRRFSSASCEPTQKIETAMEAPTWERWDVHVGPPNG